MGAFDIVKLRLSGHYVDVAESLGALRGAGRVRAQRRGRGGRAGRLRLAGWRPQVAAICPNPVENHYVLIGFEHGPIILWDVQVRRPRCTSARSAPPHPPAARRKTRPGARTRRQSRCGRSAGAATAAWCSRGSTTALCAAGSARTPRRRTPQSLWRPTRRSAHPCSRHARTGLRSPPLPASGA
jgi:hypothetical protein